ncbi:MAG TPA: glycosyltransferase family 2 protein, partial [Bacilli bacterium]|nr:glycosyltransferase family 2 protein [Bacilli bacterium]
MSNKYNVSVIIPVYNTEKYISFAIESVLNQTLDNIEIIIINDGSTDNSKSIIEKYENDNITIINKKNEGSGVARNIGVSKARGKYIFFLDSDDYLEKNALKKMYDIAETHNIGIVKGSIVDVIKCFKKTNKLYSNKINEIIDFRKNNDLLIREGNIVCNKLIRKDLLNNLSFSTRLKWEDLAIIVPLLIKAKKMYLLKDKTYYYRATIANTTVSDFLKPNIKFLDIFKTIEHLFSNLKVTKYDNVYDNIIKQIAILHITYRIENIFFWKINKKIKKGLLGIFSKLTYLEYNNYYNNIIFIKNVNNN